MEADVGATAMEHGGEEDKGPLWTALSLQPASRYVQLGELRARLEALPI